LFGVEDKMGYSERPRWGRWSAAAAAALLASSSPVRADDQIQTVDMYRAMQKPPGGKETLTLSNNNLADVVGVLRYVHQEIIVEHGAGDPARTSRKYEIDSFGHYRMKVRNPDSILQDEGKMAMPGFGRYGAFDFGVATTEDLLQGLVTDGDFVGISKEDSPQINFTHSWHWFSVDGPCPNLPWTCVPPFPGCSKPEPPTKPDLCESTGCAGKFDKDAQVCAPNPEYDDPTDTATLRQCCLRYASNRSKVIEGGLCKGDPTGQPGCVYSYEEVTDKSFVMLDDLNGITGMPCGAKGERKCKDWLDWRHNCYDPEKQYRKKFVCTDCIPTGKWNITVQETPFCVEYDIHPYCQESTDLCKDKRCMALAPEDKELGLPFWQGKCDVMGNQRRAEAVAAALLGSAVKEKHLLVDEEVIKTCPQCPSTDSTVPNQCTPNFDGGPFCTRLFGGVCSECFLPGTDPAYPLPDSNPFCPYNVLQEKGNVAPALTKCKSDDPLDVCCLYGVPGYGCNASIGTDGSDAEFSVRGYLIATRLQDNKEMETFASRYVASLGGAVKNQAGFSDDVYQLWHYQPPKHAEVAWSNFKAFLNQSSSVDWDPQPGVGGNGILIAAIIAAVLLALLLVVAFIVRSRRQGQAREALLEGQSRAEQGQAVQMRN